MQFAARLLHSVAIRKTDDVHLIGVQHFDLNDGDVRGEFERIAPQLQPALTRDIADKGNAFAELIDKEHGSDNAKQIMTLLLASSLSRAVGGRIGLTENEIIEFLVSPKKKPLELRDAMGKLQEQSWFLHREEERFFVKETENLAKQIERTANTIPQPKIDQAFINRVTELLQPRERRVYQSVQVIPKFEDIQLTGTRTLIVVRPDGRVPPNDLQNFFSYITQKNNLLVLSGVDSHLADAVEIRLRSLFASEQILAGMKNGDSLYKEALERKDQAEDLFLKALSASYNRIYYPGIEGTDESERLLFVTIEQGLNLGEGSYSAEAQIETVLSGPRANYKLAHDLKSSAQSYIEMAEEILWPAGRSNRRIRWAEVISRAKSLPAWPWIPGASGMETLKTEALKRDKWRVSGDSYIEKGPFPKDKTTVNVSVVTTDDRTKETILSLQPRNAGANPQIFYSSELNVSQNDPQVKDFDNFRTRSGTLYFLVVDPTGGFETGKPVCWKADIKVQHQVETIADKRLVKIQSIPKADIFFTIDATSPRNGNKYTEPFEIGNEAVQLLIYAKSDEAIKEVNFKIPPSGKKQLLIDDIKPARLLESLQVSLSSTEQVYSVLQRFKDEHETLFKGVRIELGDGDDIVTLRITKKSISAATLEQIIDLLRDTLSIDHAPVALKIYDGINFQSGLGLKELAKIAGITLVQSNVLQEL